MWSLHRGLRRATANALRFDFTACAHSRQRTVTLCSAPNEAPPRSFLSKCLPEQPWPLVTLAAIPVLYAVYEAGRTTEQTQNPNKEDRKDKDKDKKSSTKEEKVVVPKSQTEISFLHFLTQRKVFLNGRVNDAQAFNLTSQLLYLDSLSSTEPITMYINSGGGVVTSGLAIYDTMRSIKAPVHTVGIGHCESMAAIILASGTPGHRTALPHTRIMVHQPSISSMSGKATDIEIKARKMDKTHRTLNEIIARHTGKDADEVRALVRDDNNMTPEQAMQFGLIDSVVYPESGKEDAKSKKGSTGSGDEKRSKKSESNASADGK